MISPAAGRRIGAMVSLVDGSKPTTPRSWRRDVASCRHPRNASSATTRRCRQMTGGKGGKGGNLQSFGNSGLFDDGATRRKPAETGGNPLRRLCSRNCPQFCCLTQGVRSTPPIAISLAETAETALPTHSGFARRSPPSGRCVHAGAAKLGRCRAGGAPLQWRVHLVV